MQQEYKEKLLNFGFDLEKTLERFMGNEDLYERFLHRFIEDENIEKLKTSFEEGDIEGAFFAAHTLKGVASNLGLTPILKPLESLVEKLRAKKIDEETKRYYDNTVEKYENVIAIIQQNHKA